MKYFLSAAVFFAASLAWGQDVPPLVIDGGNVKTVQVDQVTIVKVDKILVQTFPFTIKAPPGAFDYRWSYPPSISALDMGESLQIQSGPKGDTTVGVIIKTIDFEKKKVDSRFQSIAFVIGEISPPKPPIPPVDPILTPLQKQLKVALDADTDPNKISLAGQFADILLNLVPAAKASGKITTAKGLEDLGKASTSIAIGTGSIPNTRKAVGAYLSSVISRDPATPADEAYWTVAAREHNTVGAALKGLVK